MIERVNECENFNEVIFLPGTLVRLVMKIAKTLRINCYDEFSLLDTLQETLSRESTVNQEMNEEKVISLITNVIKITEKMNNANSQLNKFELDSIFPGVLARKPSNKDEFLVFESMGFKIAKPVLLEMVYELIDKSSFKENQLMLSFVLEVVRFVYIEKSEINKQ